MWVNRAVVIPTGGEIMDGTVLDTVSPAVIFSLIRMNPLCTVYRAAPIEDEQNIIRRAVEYWVCEGMELVVLIGGSGGGHRHCTTLSEDYTWSALDKLLDEKASREIWGKNGHMWCKLVCGRRKGALVINLPGPHSEAKAAIEAFCRVYPQNSKGLEEINAAMMQAVLAQYPVNDVNEVQHRD